MTSFPAGRLVLREFTSMTEAHVAASKLAEAASTSKFDLRLIEVSPTAAGAWVCGWISAGTTSDLLPKLDFEIVEIDEAVMRAFQSLGPKPSVETTRILMVESDSIAEVFRSAHAYAKAGATLLEIRVKRAGVKGGAYAYLAATNEDLSVATTVRATSLKLVGDYRRFFF